MKYLATILFLFLTVSCGKGELDTDTVRYIEAHVDTTAAQMRFATFESVKDSTRKFTICLYRRPDPKKDGISAHNIFQILNQFPCRISDKPPNVNTQRYYIPRGTLEFDVPLQDPEKQISQWKIKSLKYTE
ncbi:MAG: hypothetical protein AAF571_06620 [Verrucomicrobiota bacterium]